MTSPVRVIVVGAGNRGENYSNFASVHPERMKVGVRDLTLEGVLTHCAGADASAFSGRCGS